MTSMIVMRCGIVVLLCQRPGFMRNWELFQSSRLTAAAVARKRSKDIAFRLSVHVSTRWAETQHIPRMHVGGASSAVRSRQRDEGHRVGGNGAAFSRSAAASKLGQNESRELSTLYCI